MSSFYARRVARSPPQFLAARYWLRSRDSTRAGRHYCVFRGAIVTDENVRPRKKMGTKDFASCPFPMPFPNRWNDACAVKLWCVDEDQPRCKIRITRNGRALLRIVFHLTGFTFVLLLYQPSV